MNSLDRKWWSGGLTAGFFHPSPFFERRRLDPWGGGRGVIPKGPRGSLGPSTGRTPGRATSLRRGRGRASATSSTAPKMPPGPTFQTQKSVKERMLRTGLRPQDPQFFFVRRGGVSFRECAILEVFFMSELQKKWIFFAL